MNKKLIVAFGMAALALGAFAGPHGHHGGHGFHRGPAIHHYGGHHHHHSGWGRGGRGFWPGFVGGVVGSLVYDALTPAPVVVTAPAVVSAPAVVAAPTVVAPAATVIQTAPVAQTQSVWVEGRYIDQVQPNGSVVRVWQPGHYEQRTVMVQ